MRHVEFFCHLPDSVTSALGTAISQCLAFFSFFSPFGNILFQNVLVILKETVGNS